MIAAVLLCATLSVSFTDEQTIDPGSALIVGAGGAAGAFVGVIAGNAILLNTPNAAELDAGAASLVLEASLITIGIGSGIGAGVAAAIVGTASDAVLASTIAFGSSIAGTGAGVYMGLAALLIMPNEIGGLLFLLWTFTGAVGGAAWGAVVGAGLPQE